MFFPTIDIDCNFWNQSQSWRTTKLTLRGVFLRPGCTRSRGLKRPFIEPTSTRSPGGDYILQYFRVDQRLHLKDVIEGQLHDSVVKAIKSKKNPYEKYVICINGSRRRR